MMLRGHAIVPSAAMPMRALLPLVMACAVGLGAMSGGVMAQSRPVAAERAVVPPVALLVPPQNPLPTRPDNEGVLNTGSIEYCTHLGAQVDTMAHEVKMPDEAAVLVREGQRLCEEGKPILGVRRLRGAYIILKQVAEKP